MAFFQNCDEQINGAGAPALGAHGAGAGAVKGFDAQILLDPFEEPFDLPTALVELHAGQRRHGKVVGQNANSIFSGVGRCPVIKPLAS